MPNVLSAVYDSSIAPLHIELFHTIGLKKLMHCDLKKGNSIPQKTPRSVKKAVALRYDEKKDTAPRVVAKGENATAQKIKEIARKYGIAIKQDDDLVELLSQIDIDKEIPAELYTVIAEILSWIYRTNEKMYGES